MSHVSDEHIRLMEARIHVSFLSYLLLCFNQIFRTCTEESLRFSDEILCDED